ncbi:hypothetical protein HPB51_015469 [Rhipicephalus microplus]|uniref:Uncharacterized protein n=1 Tax=Rhipicephalus microplus TaxID=6941 RepID=A0A9J6EAN3_RHIMP|nr:hypothetical protein HPB51_015469 [Rhipicephalus microplus]
MPAQTEVTEQHQFRQNRKKSVDSTPVPVKNVKATDVCKTGSTCITREERLFVFLSSELSKACCLFLNNIIPAFETVNCRLQAQTPLIHKLQPILLNLLEDILSRFVRPALLKQHNDICLIDYHSRNVQKDDQDLVIEHQAKCVVEKLKPSDKKEFFEAVRSVVPPTRKTEDTIQYASSLETTMANSSHKTEEDTDRDLSSIETTMANSMAKCMEHLKMLQDERKESGEQKDTIYHFCMFVASCIREMNRRDQLEAMQEVYTVIHKYQKRQLENT